MDYQPAREKIPATGPERGLSDAPITIVEFADFDSPSCGQFEHAIKDALDRYRGKIRLIYRQLPLTELHPNAQKAAEAAVCAQNQGKFWEMHDLMFLEQSRLSVEQLKEKAKRADLDTAVFDSCLEEGNAMAPLAADVDAAEQLGIGETPTTFVNGRYVEGVLTAAGLSALIEDELARLSPQTGAAKR